MSDGTVAGGGLAAGLMVVFLVELLFAVFMIYLVSRIARKAGFSGWWALMMIVPIANLVMLIVFAFVEWPVRAQLSLATVRSTGAPSFDGSRFHQFPQQAPPPYQQMAAPQHPQMTQPQQPQITPPPYGQPGPAEAPGTPGPSARPAGGMPIDPNWRGPSTS